MRRIANEIDEPFTRPVTRQIGRIFLEVVKRVTRRATIHCVAYKGPANRNLRTIANVRLTLRLEPRLGRQRPLRVLKYLLLFVRELGHMLLQPRDHVAVFVRGSAP